MVAALKFCTVCAICTFLSACQTASGSFCAISHPIRLSQTAIDALSDSEVAAVLAQNEKGQKLCGWHP
jgi:hypothetical protein